MVFIISLYQIKNIIGGLLFIWLLLSHQGKLDSIGIFCWSRYLGFAFHFSHCFPWWVSGVCIEGSCIPACISTWYLLNMSSWDVLSEMVSLSKIGCRSSPNDACHYLYFRRDAHIWSCSGSTHFSVFCSKISTDEDSWRLAYLLSRSLVAKFKTAWLKV